MGDDLYTSGEYLRLNPTWDVEDSGWKADHVLNLFRRNGLNPGRVCEVGCGAGEILARLQAEMPEDAEFWGYEISPQAYELSRQRANERLRFVLGDFLSEQDGAAFDVIMLIDVIEHLEDYFGFLRAVRPRGRYTVLHIPLDMSVQMVLRAEPIMRARAQVGHLHYFSKETALSTLRDAGYTVRDWFYTAGVVDRPKSRLNRLGRLPRRVAARLSPDLAARVLGGYSLMVLAE